MRNSGRNKSDRLQLLQLLTHAGSERTRLFLEGLSPIQLSILLNATNELIVTSHTPPDFIADCEIHARIMAAANYPSALRLIWAPITHKCARRRILLQPANAKMLQLSHLGGAKLIAPLCTPDRAINHKATVASQLCGRGRPLAHLGEFSHFWFSLRVPCVWRQQCLFSWPIWLLMLFVQTKQSNHRHMPFR